MPPAAKHRRAAPAERIGWKHVFAVREYRGLFYASLASLVGDQLARIALAILVFDRTHNALVSALVYGASYLPALLAGPLLGFVADVYPRRRIMIICDLARALIVAAMLVPGMPTAGFVVLVAVVGFLDSPFGAARAAQLPDVIPGELYPVGQSINGVLQQFAQVLGFGLGGVLVAALSARAALGIDVASFVVSALLVTAYVRPRPVVPADAPASRWSLITAGAREVMTSPLQRSLISITAVAFAAMIATESLAVAYGRQIHDGDVAVGLLTAAVPLGGTIGLVVVGRIPAARRVASFRALALLWPLPLIATVFRPSLAVACVLWAVAGALEAFQLLGNVLFAQVLTEQNRGRAFAFAQSFLLAVQGVGAVIAGVVAEATDAARAVAILAAGGLVICAPLVVLMGRRELVSTGASSPVENGRYGTVARGPAVKPAQIPSARTAEPDLVVNPTAPDAPTAPVASRAIYVYVLSGAMLGLCAWLATTDWHHHPALPVHVTWWELAILWGAFFAFRIPFQRGRDTYFVAPTQIPALLGLFFADPHLLILAAIIGPAVIDTARRIDPMRQIASRSVTAVEITVALGVFQLHTGSGKHVVMTSLLVGLAALVAGEIAGVVWMAVVRKAFQPELALSIFVRPGVFSVTTTVISAVLGLLAVTAIYANADSAALLLVIALLVSAGFRAYAKLRERHENLGQLYAFQEGLGVLVPRGPSLFPVIEQARALLNAEVVTLTLEPQEPGDPVVLELCVRFDDQPTERWVPSDRHDEPLSPPQAVAVELRIQDRRLGLLAARGRLGSARGFDRADLKLLETLGAQVSDALERGTLLEQLQVAATHDTLTGLLTLGELMRRVDERLVVGETFFLALLDVSGLRDVNDSLGHEAGDALLRMLGTRLASAMPETALIARSGGGEFAIGVPGVTAYASLTLIETLTEVGNGLLQVLDVTVELRTRTGWLVLPDDSSSASIAVRRADLALAQAKRSLHPAARYNDAMDVDGGRRLRLVSDLRTAIANRGLTVVYQPLVAPVSGVVQSAEALVRWEHPELGPLPPDEFVAIAEHSGLILDLTRFVLDEALAQCRRWHDDGREMRIAVNLSARCLTDMSLPGTVLELLARHRVPAESLTLEVTETSVAEEPVRALAVLQRLRGIGVRLSIDDFGTGYSSLASLKRFPVHEVKLDRQFLLDIEHPVSGGRDDWALIAAIVALGHTLDLEIVAEGVETTETFGRLRDLGVDLLQGYLIGRPGRGDLILTHFDLANPETVVQEIRP